MTRKPHAERLIVYSIIERRKGKPFWHRIGTAFVNRDGSFTIYFDSFPIEPRIHVRAAPEEAEAAAEAQSEAHA